MAEGKTWTEVEIRDLIQIEVFMGQTMQVFNAAITSGELSSSVGQVAATAHAGFTDTMRAFEIQAGQITVQEREIKRASDEIQLSSRTAAPLSPKRVCQPTSPRTR